MLGAEEVVCFLKAVPSLKARAALTIAYAAELHASEAASIKVADIDSRRMVTHRLTNHGGQSAQAKIVPEYEGVTRRVRVDRLASTQKPQTRSMA